MSSDDGWNVFPKLKRLKESDASTTSIGTGSNKRTGQYFTDRATASRQRGINVASKFGTGGLGRVLVSERKGRDGDKLPGMEGLYHILCDMRRDIKKVSDVQSLQGAKKWAKKRYDDEDSALNTDLNADGIGEIVVYDPYGNPVMINGYTTKDSQWPVNQKYFAANPTKEQRKEKSKRSFMDEQFQVRYDDIAHPGKVSFKTPAWVSDTVEQNYRISKPRDKTPYQLFTYQIVKRCLREYS